MSETAPAEPAIGVVVIGRNEGERLRRCLASLKGRRVVYVDSGSTDGSVDAAKVAGAEVAPLDPSEGFTAARARNLGAARLAEGGAPEFIQFVDGDCEVAPGWIEAAADTLMGDPKLAVVAGRRREVAPGASIFNLHCDMEWNTPIGDAAAVGGDAMYRRAAFDAVGGFDGAFICGEEPELCFRLRAEGWRVRRLDHDMTRHDAAITDWRQWWARTRRSGWAAAEGAATHGASPERYYVRDDRSIVFWGGAVPAGILVAAVLAIAASAAGSPGGAILTALTLAGVSGFALMALRVARYRRRAFGDPAPDAALYGALTMIGKIPQFLGALDYRKHSRAGKAGSIIEYKAPPAATPQAGTSAGSPNEARATASGAS